MFALDNVIIIMFFGFVFFLVFSFLNVLTFTKDALTAIYLTLMFCYFFFVMPFKAINTMHKNREQVIDQLIEENELNEDEITKMRNLLSKRYKLFISLFKAGELSYSDTLNNIRSWYRQKPFRLRIKFHSQNKKAYEVNYMKDLQNDIHNFKGA